MSRIYYPEEIAAMEAANPGMRFDRHGRAIDDGGYGESLQGWSPYKPDYGMQNPYGDLSQDVSNLFYKSDSLIDQDWDRYYRPQFGAGYDFGMGDALRNAVQGLDGFNYRPENGEQYGLSLLGMPGPGQHLDLGTPRAGLHTRWNPNTGSWDRMTNNPDSWSEAGAMDFSKWGQETPH